MKLFMAITQPMMTSKSVNSMIQQAGHSYLAKLILLYYSRTLYPEFQSALVQNTPHLDENPTTHKVSRLGKDQIQIHTEIKDKLQLTQEQIIPLGALKVQIIEEVPSIRVNSRQLRLKDIRLTSKRLKEHSKNTKRGSFVKMGLVTLVFFSCLPLVSFTYRKAL